MERRLAAILAVDVVGYSRLLEQDEAGTFELVRQRRSELIEPAIAPEFSPAYYYLSFTHNQDYVNGWAARPEESQERGYELACKAIALDGRGCDR